MDPWHRHYGLGKGVFAKLRQSDGALVYYCRYTYRGKRVIERAGLERRDAAALYSLRKRELEDGTYVPPNARRHKKKAAIPPCKHCGR